MQRDYQREDPPAAKRKRLSSEMPKSAINGGGGDGVVAAPADVDAKTEPTDAAERTLPNSDFSDAAEATIVSETDSDIGADDVGGDEHPKQAEQLFEHQKQFEPTFGAPPNHATCGDMDPDSFIKLLVNAYLGFTPQTLPTLTLPESYFPGLNEEHLAAYGIEVVAAVRENDFEAVKDLHHSGHALSCCNRFGESLLHMACRRGYTQVFHFLLNDADVDVRIKDDCGRTPLHDACWNREPQYEIMDALLQRDPALLLMADKRGHTPFTYARREHWGVWRQFLSDRAQFIVRGLDKAEERKIFGGPEQ